jgi:hypothetical protein
MEKSVLVLSLGLCCLWSPCLKVLTYSDWEWERTRRGADVWCTALQARRSRVRFPMCSLGFSLTYSLRPHYGPVVDSASNRNEYQEDKGGRWVGLTTLPSSCADCLEILESSNSWSPRGLHRPAYGYLYFYCLWKYTCTSFKCKLIVLLRLEKSRNIL